MLTLISLIFLGKIVGSFGEKPFISFEALSMQIIMMYLIFHTRVNCGWNFKWKSSVPEIFQKFPGQERV